MIQLSLFQSLIKVAEGKAPAFISTSPKLTGHTAGQVETALRAAETPSDVFKNPWIRTTSAPPGGSTAWGPLQITGGKAEDFMTNPNKMNWINPTNKPFLTNFVNQSKWFKYYGKNPTAPGYKPMYDYGGTGVLTNAADKAHYMSMGKDMIRYELNDSLARKGNPIVEFLKNWHSRTAPLAVDYRNRFENMLNKFKPGTTNEVPVGKPQISIGK